MTGRETSFAPARHAAKALLGYALDTLLSGTPPGGSGTRVPNPWDAWWAAYRAGRPLAAAGTRVSAGGGGACAACASRALALAAASPPGHPGIAPGPCGCLLRWATAMRSPGPPPGWPPTALSLALIKPGAPAGLIRSLLAGDFDVLSDRELILTAADTRRLYPEAYGAAYVAGRDAYLTSGPAQVLTLAARRPAVGWDVKARIRAQARGDALRNHLHMPDNPGEALADIAHFAGYDELARLYRRYERDHTNSRLAFYRTALGIGPPCADRLAAAG